MLSKKVCTHCYQLNGYPWTKNTEMTWTLHHMIHCPYIRKPGHTNPQSITRLRDNTIPNHCRFQLEHLMQGDT